MNLNNLLNELNKEIDYNFNERLFISILLCLSSGEKNLILRIGLEGEGELLNSEERKELIKRVGEEVDWICTSIFSLATHTVTCNPNTSATNFLRSLFLPSTISTSTNSGKGLRSTGSFSTSNPKRPEKTPRRTSTSSPIEAHFPVASTSKLTGTEPSPIFSTTEHFTTDPISFEQDSSAGEDFLPLRPPSLQEVRRGLNSRRHTVTSGSFLAAQKLALESYSPSSPFNVHTHPHSKETINSKSTSTGKSPTKTSFLDRPFGFYPSPPRRASFVTQTSANTPRPIPISPNHASFPRNFRAATSPIRSPIPLNLTSTPPLSLNPHKFSPTSLNKPIPPGSPPSISNRHSLNFDSSSSPPKSVPPSLPLLTTHQNENVNNISLHPKILPQVLILERLEKSRPSVQQVLTETLKDRRIVLSSNSSTSNSASPNSIKGIIPTVSDLIGKRKGTLVTGESNRDEVVGTETGTGTATGIGIAGGGGSFRARRNTGLVLQQEEGLQEWEGSFNLPKGFLVVGIVVEKRKNLNEHMKGVRMKVGEGGGGGGKKIDAAWGGLSRYLFDHFSISQSIPISSFNDNKFFSPPLVHPLSSQFTSPHSNLKSIISSNLTIPKSKISSIKLSDALTTYISDLISTLRSNSHLNSRMLTAKTSDELIHFLKIWVLLTTTNTTRGGGGGGGGGGGRKRPEVIVPTDVFKVLMSVIGHRLMMKEVGDETSMFWGSTVEGLARDEERLDGVEGVVRCIIGMV